MRRARADGRRTISSTSWRSMSGASEMSRPTRPDPFFAPMSIVSGPYASSIAFAIWAFGARAASTTMPVSAATSSRAVPRVWRRLPRPSSDPREHRPGVPPVLLALGRGTAVTVHAARPDPRAPTERLPQQPLRLCARAGEPRRRRNCAGRSQGSLERLPPRPRPREASTPNSPARRRLRRRLVPTVHAQRRLGRRRARG